MAGTNTSQPLVPENISLAPAIILVRPQLGLNIGMCARAMLNCAVTELRVVAPRDGWPNDDAIASSSGATALLDNAKVFDTTAEAVADLEFVLATTARERGMVKEVYTAQAAAQLIHKMNSSSPHPNPLPQAGEGTKANLLPPLPLAGEGRGEGSLPQKQKCGILFGPERTGLENDDIALANAILHIPLNPGFSSLNLAQAVLLVCHNWLTADNPFSTGDVTAYMGATEYASKDEIENLMVQLEQALEEGGFFRSPDQRPTLMRNIRNFFFRSQATQQDVRTLHGVFANLLGRRTWSK